MEQVPAEDDRFRALGRPAQDEYALWEMALEWEGLNDVDALLAAALRLFVITRDPLDWIPDRGSAWATSNADGDTLELPVYVTLATIRDVLDDEDRVVAVLGGLANRALSTALACQGLVFSGAHPTLAISGQAPRLLDGNACPPTGDDAPVGIGRPRVSLRSPGWEPLGLGAIQDLVQEAFGPVDLDRSQVRLDPVEVRHGGCPSDRQGIGAHEWPHRAGGPPDAATTGRPAGAQRPLPVRQWSQVQALLRRVLTATASDRSEATSGAAGRSPASALS